MVNAFPKIATSKIDLSPTETPGHTHAKGLTQESANRTSELLTTNHALYHTRFNAGFHNHLAHHLLALWSLGATPSEIQDQWDFNQPYQIPIERKHEAISEYKDLKDPALFDKCLGNDDCYADFLKFFEDEIAEKGTMTVLKEYMFKGDTRADDIFCRTYTDLVHPIIHFGCAIEFQQPSLVAETLAAACVHDNWPKHFLLATEDLVNSKDAPPSRPLLETIEDVRHDPHISTAVKDDDPFNKIRDGLLKRVTGEQFAPFLGQFQVEPDPVDLQRKMSEMMHTCAYVTGAAQRPGKREMLDFVLLHNVTLAVFYPAVLAQDWLSDHDKARLIEAKARVDVVQYAACKSPQLYPERIREYVPRHPEHGWPELFHRSIIYHDEGHAVKLIRALYAIDQLPEMGGDFPIAKQDFMKIAHVAMDSIERAFEKDGSLMPEAMKAGVVKQVGQGGEMVVDNLMRWVYYGGLEKAWQYVPGLVEGSA